MLTFMEILLVALAVQAVNTILLIGSRHALLLSNVAMRQQLAVYKRRQARPFLKDRDRLFWSLLSRIWRDWKSVLVVVQPETVLRWQKKRFRDYWRKKSKPGRPAIDRQHIAFIRRVSGDHPEYGEDRIALELETLAWVEQQIRDATFEEQPKFLFHDNDGIYGQLGKGVTREANGKKVSCRSTLDFWLADSRGIRGIPTPYHAPNAAAHVESFNGTLRREVLDRILVWNEGQLRTVLTEYTYRWYNNSRVHQGIHGIPDPDPELARPKPVNGGLVARPVLGGLHHDYRLAA